MKTCNRCDKKIPEEYNNLLCDQCYAVVSEENAKAKAEAAAELARSPEAAINVSNIVKADPISTSNEPNLAPTSPVVTSSTDFGIKQPGYVENPEKDDKDQVLANLAQFIYSHDEAKHRPGKLLWYPTRNMYNYVRNYCLQKVQQHPQYPKYIWKPKIVDVGCGSGVGTNVLSQEADFVWGIDKNAWSIEFAKEAFTREKNGIYYSAQETFDVIDIMTENRELMKFDIVVAIEIIEHIYDTHKFLNQIIHHFTKRDKFGKPLTTQGTEFFISTPNRNSPKIKKDQPENVYHVREYTSGEFFDFLSRYFGIVKLLNNKGEPVEKDCLDDLVLAHCLNPKI